MLTGLEHTVSPSMYVQVAWDEVAPSERHQGFPLGRSDSILRLPTPLFTAKRARQAGMIGTLGFPSFGGGGDGDGGGGGGYSGFVQRSGRPTQTRRSACDTSCSTLSSSMGSPSVLTIPLGSCRSCWSFSPTGGLELFGITEFVNAKENDNDKVEDPSTVAEEKHDETQTLKNKRNSDAGKGAGAGKKTKQ